MATVYFASDHAGYELKEILMQFLAERGVQTEDLGPSSLVPDDDYPDYMVPLASRVVGQEGAYGIGIGGSGQGEAMAINRIKGARAAVFYGGTLDVVKATREHNNANILCLGARFVSQEQAKAAVELFLSTLFSNDERHVRRITKLG